MNDLDYQNLIKERINLLFDLQMKLISQDSQLKTDMNTGITISAIGPSAQLLIESFIANKDIPNSWKFALICGFDFLPDIRKEFLDSLPENEREKFINSRKYIKS
jgi:hypothetical protein